jgi:putative transposase
MSSWPHAPPHFVGSSGLFMVTAGTYQKKHLFKNEECLQYLHDLLLELLAKHNWQLHAWVIFSNHYHFIANSSATGSEALNIVLREFHSISARWINARDDKSGRKVWHNYMESLITTEKSHLARLHYVHANAVHHKLVLVPNQYRWCSAAWFERVDTSARVKTVYGFPCDKLWERDEY